MLTRPPSAAFSALYLIGIAAVSSAAQQVPLEAGATAKN
jgi:hypothetical protein